MILTESMQRQLLEAAAAVRRHAYAPYSHYRVGAAVLASAPQRSDEIPRDKIETGAGEKETAAIYLGCNVENASYGLTICAERMAVGAAVAAGAPLLRAIAIVADKGPSPCGACRQFLAELGQGMTVLLADPSDLLSVRSTTLDALLPDQFRLMH